MQGYLLYNGERFRYELNAAYQLTLYGSDTSFVFGCESSECDDYYIPIVNGKNCLLLVTHPTIDVESFCKVE